MMKSDNEAMKHEEVQTKVENVKNDNEEMKHEDAMIMKHDEESTKIEKMECDRSKDGAPASIKNYTVSLPEFGDWLCPVGAGTDAAQFKAEGERIRMACLAERLAAEAGGAGQRASILVTEKLLLAAATEQTDSC